MFGFNHECSGLAANGHVVEFANQLVFALACVLDGRHRMA